MRTDVKNYLENLKTYIYGDLGTFEAICQEIEQKESVMNIDAIPHKSSSFQEGIEEQSSTTTVTTNSDASTSGNTNLQSGKIHFRSTIPHVLAVLSIMDLLGYLTGQENTVNNTKNNISKFLAPLITDIDKLNCLIILYRHGMSHSFFPKVNIAIAAHSKLNGKDLFYLDSKDKITLNSNKLIELMKYKFESILDDSTIHLNIENQFDKLVALEENQLTKIGLDLNLFASTLTKEGDL
jgi:hypothetical protein